ncbi:MAG: alkaline phosphatase D family protein [Saprospiraceae bacterium]|nr:alkaline phosphatase D family protein [Lewinella sp.]
MFPTSKLYCFRSLLLSISCFVYVSLPAQIDQPNSLGKGATLYQHDRGSARGDGPQFNPDWAPFYHGVASGDPLSDRVIIWTRVTPEDLGPGEVPVEWRMATDPELSNVIASGNAMATLQQDFTVKVDVSGLDPGTTYYYGFTALGRHSLTGKTKTTPIAGNIDHFKFGVVSCSNYQAGYFNAYGQLAKRTDLDAIIHLGDYIYEYADRVYGNNVVWQDRNLEPEHEIISLEDYRTRYSTYRLDTNLIRLHQQYPFITIWDDHESANDSYALGAENHDEATEGSWTDRKQHAKQAYFEWIPIRDNAQSQVYRRIQYGDLIDLILLDTRLEGREQQINDIEDEALYDPDRTILGVEQKAWLKDQLDNSTAQWKIIGQQVIFAELNVGWAGSLVDSTYAATESAFLDIWDGYPAERTEIINYISGNVIDNVVILTGDFHCSFGFDIADPPVAVTLQEVQELGLQPFYQANDKYDAATGVGSVAVEFATPSITSANFDENAGALAALAIQLQINKEAKVANGTVSLGNPNPHMKYVDLVQHGYYILDVKPEKAQANWYFSPILQAGSGEAFGAAYYTQAGSNHLQQATSASGPKSMQDVPAPTNPPRATTPVLEAVRSNELVILSSFPNPTGNYHRLHYALNHSGQLQILLLDTNGRQIRTLLDEQMPAGLFSLRTDLNGLAAGTYYYHLQMNDEMRLLRLVKQ